MWIKQRTKNKQGDTEIKIVWHEPKKKTMGALPVSYSNIPATYGALAGKAKRAYNRKAKGNE